MNDFYSIIFQANLLYGVSINEDDAIEIGLIGWNHIGNKNTRLYQIELPVIDDMVELPCNAILIEAVTYNFEDWQYVSNKYNYGDMSSQFSEHYIEAGKVMNNPLYMSGRYAKFKQVGNILYMEEKAPKKVKVLYHGVFLDKEGLPKINNKEINALAAYLALTVYKKEFLATGNQASLTKAQLAEADWQRYCDLARVPEHINQNEMNEILDAKTSWNRKIFNKAYKPVK